MNEVVDLLIKIFYVLTLNLGLHILKKESNVVSDFASKDTTKVLTLSSDVYPFRPILWRRFSNQPGPYLWL